jgi:hypothetical protein
MDISNISKSNTESDSYPISWPISRSIVRGCLHEQFCVRIAGRFRVRFPALGGLSIKLCVKSYADLFTESDTCKRPLICH